MSKVETRPTGDGGEMGEGCLVEIMEQTSAKLMMLPLPPIPPDSILQKKIFKKFFASLVII